MNKKTVYLVVAVLVVVIVVAAAGVLLLNNGGNNNNSTTPTPTPAPSVANATSLQFTVQDSSGNYTYYAKDADGIATDVAEVDLQLRLEILGTDTYVYVINTATQKAASNTTGTMATEAYQATYDMWVPLFQNYVSKLGSWTGTGDYTYTDSGASVTISCIAVNPTLADSLFATG